MLRKIGLGFTLVAALAFTAAPAGEEVQLEGKLACAKCMLHDEDYEDCQSVLIVNAEGGGDPTYYYLVENDVAEEFGHACKSARGAVVTGTVENRDGNLWLHPSRMEAPEEA